MCSKEMQMLEARIQLGFFFLFFPNFDIKKVAKVRKLH